MILFTLCTTLPNVRYSDWYYHNGGDEVRRSKAFDDLLSISEITKPRLWTVGSSQWAIHVPTIFVFSELVFAYFNVNTKKNKCSSVTRHQQTHRNYTDEEIRLYSPYHRCKQKRGLWWETRHLGLLKKSIDEKIFLASKNFPLCLFDDEYQKNWDSGK